MAQIFTAPVRAATYMVIAGGCFALVNSALQATTMLHGASAPAVTFWQYLIAVLFYIPWMLSRLRSENGNALSSSAFPLHVLRVVFAAGGVQLWTLGLAHVPIWQAIALILLSPFFVTLGAGLILRENVSLPRWAAVVAGIIGGCLILAPWSDNFRMSALLPVGAAALWAASSIVTKKLTYTDSAETITLYLLILLSPINALLALGTGFTVPSSTYGLILGAGLLTAFAQHILARAYAQADAAFLQPFDHLKLVFNVALGFVLFGFAPSGNMWLGTAIILGASVYLLQRESETTATA